MAWTRAEAVASSTAGTTSASAALTGDIAAGDLLLAFAHCSNADPPANPFSDDANGNWGGSYLLTNTVFNSSGRLYVGWVLASAARGGGSTLTVQGAAGSTRCYCIFVRYTNAGAKSKVDQAVAHDAGTPGGTTFDSGLTAIAAAVDDLLIGAFVEHSGVDQMSAGSDGGGNSYTLGLSVNKYLSEEYILAATAGTKKATATVAANNGWTGAVLIFTAGAVSPGIFASKGRPGPRLN